MEKKKEGRMSVQEAGHKGGQRVKQLIEEGKRALDAMPDRPRQK